MSFPSPWVAIVLSLATYRLWRLVALDLILDRPRRMLVRLSPSWEEGREINPGYRYKLAEFITCAWCSGFWISLAVWGCWQVFPHATEVLCVPLVISAVVGLVRGNIDDEE